MNLYNILLKLSRNKLFYEKISLPDTFETRIYLMFFHFSLMMIVYKKKGSKFNQDKYDILFHNIENNLRELGHGDVAVNKKMKDLNKILYDILLKIEKKNVENFNIDSLLIFKYFQDLNNDKGEKFVIFNNYLVNFYNFCFELPLENVVEGSINFKYK